jgi:SAM-dependent methyltransferase
MDDVADYYQRFREDLRLRAGWGALELARTQELIRRHLPPPPRRVLDVGGAAGIYSGWLGSLGYETYVLDPVAHHIEQARRNDHITSAEVGDARELPNANESVDAILLFGPLYHLVDQDERLKALREAWRVLRPGGVVFAAAICRFASLLDSLVRGFVDDPRFAAILEQDLDTGQHRNPTDDPNYFTTAFFHLPEELASELVEAGFHMIELVGVEGPGWLADKFEERWADPVRRERLLHLMRRVEHEPALLGVSQHLLAVVKKP